MPAYIAYNSKNLVKITLPKTAWHNAQESTYEPWAECR